MCRPHCFCYCIRLANDNPVIIGKKLLNIELFGEFEGALGLLQRLDAVEGIDAWLSILFALAEHIPPLLRELHAPRLHLESRSLTTTEAVVGNLQHAIPTHSINDLCKVLLF